MKLKNFGCHENQKSGLTKNWPSFYHLSYSGLVFMLNIAADLEPELVDLLVKYSTEKKSVASKIQTQIMGVEGKDADHYASTTGPAQLLF